MAVGGERGHVLGQRQGGRLARFYQVVEDFMTGARWVLSVRVLICWVAICVLLLSGAIALGEDGSSLQNPFGSLNLGDLLASSLIIDTVLTWLITLKGRDLRIKSDYRRVVHSYTELLEERLTSEFAEKIHAWEEEREEWKVKAMAEIYESVLDQVERGVLKPRDAGSDWHQSDM